MSADINFHNVTSDDFTIRARSLPSGTRWIEIRHNQGSTTMFFNSLVDFRVMCKRFDVEINAREDVES